MPTGTCKLTGEVGKFVKAHLIPAALTRPERHGAPLVQYKDISRPIRRWTSWYDTRLVIDRGEQILTEYDTWAIATLRQHKLIWSSWGAMTKLNVPDHSLLPGTPWGIRLIKTIDAPRLRLFFLSLLWRAAASKLREFSPVSLATSDLELLRKLVISGDPGRASFYPISLIQISTFGSIHNQSPTLHVKDYPSIGKIKARSVPIFRFYFDGLIAHIEAAPHAQLVDEMGPLILCGAKEIALSTVAFDESLERDQLIIGLNSAYGAWPSDMHKLIGPPKKI